MNRTRSRRATASLAALAVGCSLAMAVAAPQGARAAEAVRAGAALDTAPAELVTNGDIEAGTAGWTAVGSATLSLGYSTRHGGAMSLKVNGRTAHTDGASRAIEGLIAGTTYDVSAWVHYRDLGDASTDFAVVLSDAGGSSRVMAQSAVEKGSSTATTTFGHVSGSFTVPTTGLDLSTAKVSIQSVGPATVPDIFFVDDISVYGEREVPPPPPDPLERNDNTAPGSFGAFAKTPGTDAASRRGNPLVTQNFGADPWAMEHDGRVYVYTTNDTQEWVDHVENGESNNYGRINEINVWSSADLVNWTNHGPINAAGADGITRAATNRPGNSWAPAAAAKDVDGDGDDEFFLYFANSAGGIWVLRGESPLGPFTSPLNRSLIGFDTPGVNDNSNREANDVVWLFDPAVLVDDDGEAYIYFGGGVPTGEANHPNTARMAKLGDDMVSLADDNDDGQVDEVQMIDAPGVFEDSGIHKVGDTYYYTYCTNFSHTLSGVDFGRGDIVVMESDSPLGPWSEPKLAFANQAQFFGAGTGGNNHHAFFDFQGSWYLTYHAQTLDVAIEDGASAGYRNAHIDEVDMGADGTIAPVTGTYAGPGQKAAFDPYEGPVSAETIAWQAGTRQGYVGTSTWEGQTPTPKLTSIDDGDWTSLAGVDFGDGAAGLTARVLPKAGGTITVSTSPDPAQADAVVGSITVPAGDGSTWTDLDLPLAEGALTGTNDLFFRYSGEDAGQLFDVETWSFAPVEAPQPVETAVSVAPVTMVYGQVGWLRVAVSGADEGTVSTTVGGRKVTAEIDEDGKAKLPIARRSLPPGTHDLTVSYAGTPEFAPSSTSVRVSVVKARGQLTVSAPTKVRTGSYLTVRARVSASGLSPTGKVTVALAGVRVRPVTAVVRDGVATVRLRVPRSTRVGTKQLRVTYTGSPFVTATKAVRSVRVTR
ncbi:family 43 glycosylhydrolase [Nocardioides aromaticivorans]|nr:family 43 glycosylhydrolase [Nocardioides aromaticivorans]